MTDALFRRRFTLFLLTFIAMLFGNIFFPHEMKEQVEMILLLVNMASGALLFHHQPKREQLIIWTVIFLGILARLNQQYMELNSPYLFTAIYLIYFFLISYRIFFDLNKQKVVGLETISAAFGGFILLGVVSSIIFITMDVSMNAFEGIEPQRPFYDYLYFSFITLLTIGYGEITPTLEISKKVVLLVSLIGHFYTVFVIAIIIGKYLRQKEH